MIEKFKTEETIEELFLKRKKEKKLTYEKFYYLEILYRDDYNENSKYKEEYKSWNDVDINFDSEKESIMVLKDISTKSNFLCFSSYDNIEDYLGIEKKEEIYSVNTFLKPNKTYFQLITIPLLCNKFIDDKNIRYKIYNPNNKPIFHTIISKRNINKVGFTIEEKGLTPLYRFEVYCFKDFIPEAKKLIIKEIERTLNNARKTLNYMENVYLNNFIEIDYDNKNKVIKSEKIEHNEKNWR